MKERQIDIFDLLVGAWKLKYIIIAVFIILIPLANYYAIQTKPTDLTVKIKIFPANFDSVNSFSLLRKKLEFFNEDIAENIFFSNFNEEGNYDQKSMFKQYINHFRKFVEFDLVDNLQKLDNGAHLIYFEDTSNDSLEVAKQKYENKISTADKEFRKSVVKMINRSLEQHSESVERELSELNNLKSIYEQETQAAVDIAGEFINEVTDGNSSTTDLTIKATELAKYIEQRVEKRRKLKIVSKEVNELLKSEDIINNDNYQIYDFTLIVEEIGALRSYYMFLAFVLWLVIVILTVTLSVSYQYRQKENSN